MISPGAEVKAQGNAVSRGHPGAGFTSKLTSGPEFLPTRPFSTGLHGDRQLATPPAKNTENTGFKMQAFIT